MGLKEILKKQGGMSLIKQYWKGGALFTAVGEFILLGKNRTGLEILRLSTQLKIKLKLQKTYGKKLTIFDEQWNNNAYKEKNELKPERRVWICWFQGMDSAPDIVKKCYSSIKQNIKDREIVLITEKNINDYVKFPDFIQNKIDRGIIKGAHLSDLLRLELLTKYGGTWIDSTVYCSRENIPSYMLDSDLFLFQNLKPGRDGNASVISNWFITSSPNNRILNATLYLLYEYWKKNNTLVDYFIFHDFFQIVIEKYESEWNKVIPFSNSTPHILLLRLFEIYKENTWEAMNEQTPFHKLTYKFDDKQKMLTGTYYDVLFR